MSENQQILEQAYMLIEAQKLGEARALLEKVLAQDKNSADVWWLYAHAVDDPKQAVSALEQVAKLDPSNDEAKTLLQTARQQASIGADDEFDIDFDDENLAPQEDDEPTDTRRRSFIIFGAILMLVALGLFILIASPRGEETANTTGTATFVAQGVMNDVALTATAEAISLSFTPVVIDPIGANNDDLTATTGVMTLQPIITNTPISPDVVVNPTSTPEIIATSTQADTNLIPSADNFLASLTASYPTNGTTETVETVFGATLLVPMCTTRGEDHNTLIPQAMLGLSQNIGLLPIDYAAVGVRFLNCDTNETINVMALSSQSALEYNNADLSEQDFRRAWRVIDA